MIVSRSRRMEKKGIEIYVNNKILKQVNSLKYLGIIFDSKLTFRDHINYTEEKCSKLIFSLSRSAKITSGLKHETLKTIYTGCNRRNGPDFGRVFLMLNCTEKPQNTNIQS